MESSRTITVRQLRKYADQQHLKPTAAKGEDSIHRRLEAMFADGDAFPSYELEEIFDPHGVREPRPYQLYALATILGVPMVCLMIDMDQPYEHSPLGPFEQDGSGMRYYPTNVSVFTRIIDTTMPLPASLAETRFPVMGAAYTEAKCAARLRRDIAKANHPAADPTVPQTGMAEAANDLIGASRILLATPGVYYPTSVRMESVDTVRTMLGHTAVTEADLDGFADWVALAYEGGDAR